MKKILVISILVLGFSSLYGQSAVDKIFNKYAGKDGYTTVVINSFMFKFLSSIDVDDPEYQNFKKATSGIESIKILTSDDAGSKGFARELLDILPRENYEELMVVKEADEEVVFLVKEENDRISEFLLIVSSDSDEDALIVITGDIDLETISSITSGLDLPAMENLDELDE